MFPNKFAKRCNCGVRVDVGEGFTENVAGSWFTYCKACVPKREPTIEAKVVGEHVHVTIANLNREQFDAYYSASKGAIYESHLRASVIPVSEPAVLCAVLRQMLECSVCSPIFYPSEDVKTIATAYENQARESIQKFKSRALAGLTLFPFQMVGAAWLSTQQSCILADDMGLGKTVQLLAAHPEGAPLLVVGPAVAKGVWTRETKRWRQDIAPITVLSGRDSFVWPKQGEAVVTNYDILTQGEVPPGVAPGTTLVLDEGHVLKNPRTSRFQRVERLVEEVLRTGGRVWLATATPLLNRHKELWNLLGLLRLQTKAYGTWGRFNRAFGYGGTPGPDAAKGLQTVMLRRTKVEVLKDLPKKMRRLLPVGVTLSRADESEVERADALMLTMGESVPFEEISRARAILAESKIPAMLELVEEYEEAGEPVVVFSCYKAPVEEFIGREGWAVITGDTSPEKRTAIEDKFQKGELRGVAATVKAGGVAITLTKACNAIFVDRDWTPALNLQAEDRIYRIGQDRPVLITQLIAERSLDYRVEEIISHKTKVIEGSIEAASNPMNELEGLLGLGVAEKMNTRLAPVSEVPTVKEKEMTEIDTLSSLWVGEEIPF